MYDKPFVAEACDIAALKWDFPTRKKGHQCQTRNQPLTAFIAIFHDCRK
jgi:hypothetical protein